MILSSGIEGKASGRRGNSCLETARRLVTATEQGNLSRLRAELDGAQALVQAQALVKYDLGEKTEERLELLATVALDMQNFLDLCGYFEPVPEIRARFGPHLELLRHLAEPSTWLN